MSTFRHSGKCGDVVYGMRCVQALGGGTILIDPMTYYGNDSPLGISLAKQLVNLINTQNYSCAEVVKGEEVCTHDMDLFRNQSWRNQHLIISHWLALKQTRKLDLSLPWFHITPKHEADIIISMTWRSKNTLDWSCLEKYKDRCLFVGRPNEWRKFCGKAFKVDHYVAKSLIDLAQIISGSKLFIGSQSLGFALAEAMKVNRVLEVWQPTPNCMPQSSNGHIELKEEYICV